MDGMRYVMWFGLLRVAAFGMGIVLPLSFLFSKVIPTPLVPLVFLIVFLTVWLLAETRYAHCRVQYVDRMTGEEFERYMRFWFRIHGYRKIRKTQETRDYGADLIMKKGLRRVVVQAKRYDRNIGVHAVQQAVAARDFYDASRAIVATNRYFTAAAKNLAAVNEVELIDREVLFGISQKRK